MEINGLCKESQGINTWIDQVAVIGIPKLFEPMENWYEKEKKIAYPFCIVFDRIRTVIGLDEAKNAIIFNHAKVKWTRRRESWQQLFTSFCK